MKEININLTITLDEKTEKLLTAITGLLVPNLEAETEEAIQQESPEPEVKPEPKPEHKKPGPKPGMKRGRKAPTPKKEPSPEVKEAIKAHPRYDPLSGEKAIIGGPRREKKTCLTCGQEFRTGPNYQDGFCTYRCKRLFQEKEESPIMSELNERRRRRESSPVEFNV